MNPKDIQVYLGHYEEIDATVALKDSGSQLELSQDDTLFITMLTQTLKLTHVILSVTHVKKITLEVYTDYHQTNTPVFQVDIYMPDVCMHFNCLQGISKSK